MGAHAPSFKTLLVLAWPVIVSRSSQAVIGFCDALMTAPLGEAALAATTAGAMNTFAILILPMGIVFIVQSFAAQFYGQGNLAGARRYGWYGLVLSGVAGLLAAIAIPGIGPTLSLLDFEPAVRDDMGNYLAIRFYAVAAVVGVEAVGNWYGGLGNTRLHMVASLAIMIVNVFLNWLLIEGNWGAPALGVEGAALASLIASWIGCTLLLGMFLTRYGLPKIEGDVTFQPAELWRMMRFGWPNGVNWFLEFAAFMFFLDVVVADLGTVTLAAMMVVIQVNSVSFMPAFGIASAGAILAGQAIGAHQRDHVPGIVGRTMTVAATWQVGVGVVYVLVPASIMGLFAPRATVSPEIVQIGTVLLALSAAWQLFDAIAMTLSEALRSAGDTRFCMWTRLVVAWALFVPGAWVGVTVFDGGGVAAILAVVAYLGGLAAVFAWRFRAGGWRHIDLTGPQELVHP